MNTNITRKEVQEALDFHLEQLKRRNAHLEDQVCEVLRKMLDMFDKAGTEDFTLK